MNKKDLRGSTAVVTGGAMGIGYATALRLLDEGCTVTLWDMNESALGAAVSKLSAKGRVFAHVCDVTDKKRVYELAETAKNEMGRVDILVNNAGMVKGGDLLDLPDDVHERTINVNLTSLIYTTRAFLPGMLERNKGVVVNLSSASGLLGVGGLAVYAATKWGVWGLTESIRFEVWNKKKRGVHIASVHPSYIREGLFQGAKLGFLGNLIAPLLKNHDVIAKAVVESAIKRRRHSPKRPRTVNLVPRFRALLPDFLFQRMLIIMGIHASMKSWRGREQ